MSNTAHTNAIAISFNCTASKDHFIARNKIQQSEIISETAASITIADSGENFGASPFVYAVNPA